jgi:hypothetical protein
VINSKALPLALSVGDIADGTERGSKDPGFVRGRVKVLMSPNLRDDSLGAPEFA